MKHTTLILFLDIELGVLQGGTEKDTNNDDKIFAEGFTYKESHLDDEEKPMGRNINSYCFVVESLLIISSFCLP